MRKRSFRALLAKLWAYAGILLVLGTILFLFGYIFWKGGASISWDFITQSPRGAVLGSEGGIWPAIKGRHVCKRVAGAHHPQGLFLAFHRHLENADRA